MINIKPVKSRNQPDTKQPINESLAQSHTLAQQSPGQTHQPWVEKYRPTSFEKIVLDEVNQRTLQSMLTRNHVPNLLLWGPPGVGKTTTIINLIKEYQTLHNQQNKGMVIQLNASDERGIDTIRNQIQNFVMTKGLFQEGLKFVVLDEVDYMTKSAQQALRFLIQSQFHQNNVRYFLICNYISKIDEALQNDFIKLRFNQLPKEKIIDHLKYICNEEGLSYSEDTLKGIQRMFHSDIRSMINFMQMNQDLDDYRIHIVDEHLWRRIDKYILNPEEYSVDKIIKKFVEISFIYNLDKRDILKQYINYILRRGCMLFQMGLQQNVDEPQCDDGKMEHAASEKQFIYFCDKMEMVMHTPQCDIDISLKYIILHIRNSMKRT